MLHTGFRDKLPGLDVGTLANPQAQDLRRVLVDQ